MKMGPQTNSTGKALTSGNMLLRKVHVITPAAQAGKKADKKFTSTSQKRTGLFFVAYQT